MLGDRFIVTIKNWDKYNNRSDVKKSSWFRFEHSFFDSSRFFGLNAPQRLFWIYLLCEVSKHSSDRPGTAIVSTMHATTILTLSIKDLHHALQIFEEFQMVEVRTLRGRYVDVSQTCSTDVTDVRTDGHIGLRPHPKSPPQEATLGPPESGQLTLVENRPPGEPPQPAKPAKPQLPRLARIWNARCGGLPKVLRSNSARDRKAEARWRESPDEAYWVSIVDRIARSSFCLGGGNTGWRASFDWLLQPETHLKVFEGKYENKSPGELQQLAIDPEKKKILDEIDRAMDSQL